MRGREREKVIRRGENRKVVGEGRRWRENKRSKREHGEFDVLIFFIHRNATGMGALV